MNFLSKYNITPAKVVKSALIGIGILIALTVLIKLVGLPMGGARVGGFGGVLQGMPSVLPSYDSVGYSAESPTSYGKEMTPGLSARNLLPIFPPRIGTTGNDAEAYEVTDYSARFESRKVEKTCATIKEWKTLSYVIFENASESDEQCYYTFKVEHSRVEEVLAKVKALNPKDLTQNTSTIKQQIEDFTSRSEILKKKRDALEKTLESALRAYDEITALATRTQNADALAKIIDSKVGIIERLTQERININAELDALALIKERELDRLTYTYFNISVYKNTFFDGERLADSWKEVLKDFVQTVNVVLQSITVGLLGFIVWLLPILLYAFLVLVIVKYVWRGVKRVWAR
ncbi:MAG: hypothetical protein Q7R64_02280 [bacterium]|nr:hypothetical protein [bacterium]